MFSVTVRIDKRILPAGDLLRQGIDMQEKNPQTRSHTSRDERHSILA